jgi:hypothetical protein
MQTHIYLVLGMNAEILEGPAAVLDAECVLRVLCQRLQNELDAVELCYLHLRAAYVSICQHTSAFAEHERVSKHTWVCAWPREQRQYLYFCTSKASKDRVRTPGSARGTPV